MTEQCDIVLLDDDQSITAVLEEALASDGWSVKIFKSLASLMNAAPFKARLMISDVLLGDGNALDQIDKVRKRVGDIPIIMMSAHNTLATAMQSAQVGAVDYLSKPFDLEILTDTVRKLMPYEGENSIEATDVEDDSLLIGRSTAMQSLYRDMARIAQSDLSVLVSGESGTGKELVARALHQHGMRKDKAFVSVNMAAIPRELIESELFGHKKGAFTGAVDDYKGRFREAHQGTLFLDEIGDMPIDTQSRLLRVLQEGEVRGLGDDKTFKIDVRIIAATHQDLPQLIAEGKFREDLFFRLNVVPLRLPPLRARREDIEQLTWHFMKRLGSGDIEAAALEALTNYHWPGNVRELENMIRRLFVLMPSGVITYEAVRDAVAELAVNNGEQRVGQVSLRDAIGSHIDHYFELHEGSLPPDGLYNRLIVEFETPLIERCLKATNGNQVKTAKLLGINRNTLRQRIKDLHINIKEY